MAIESPKSTRVTTDVLTGITITGEEELEPVIDNSGHMTEVPAPVEEAQTSTDAG